MKKITLAAALLLITSVSQAAMIQYKVTDYNGGSAQHGLWTNNDYTTDRYFSVVDGMTFTINDNNTASVADDVAHLRGMAVATGFNPDLYADIDLYFTGGLSSLSSPYVYKQEGGLPYASLTDAVFWTNVFGTIKIGGNTYDVARMVWNNGRRYTFQFGVGANAKNKTELGGSAWIQTCQDSSDLQGGSCMNSHHWDLNLAMIPTSVPAPSVLAMLLGAAGLLIARRRRV